MRWQPIDTAPKDGTVVELWTHNGTHIKNVQWLTGAQRDPARCGPGGIWEHLAIHNTGWDKVGSDDGCGCLVEDQFKAWRLPEIVEGPDF